MKLDIERTLSRLSQIQSAMGIDRPVELPALDWTALSGKGIDVDPAEVGVDDEGIIRYNGQAVVTYIRDQTTSPSGNWSAFKYHLTDCATIQGMRHGGRSNRYTVTNRTDGWFACSVGSSWGPRSERTLRMRLCLNCLKHLEPETYGRMSKHARLEASRSYDLAAHFHTYQNVGHTPPVPLAPARAPAPASGIQRQREMRWASPAPPPAQPPRPPSRAAPPAPESAPAPSRPSLIGLPSWVPSDADELFQAALLHIDRHGSISEPELAKLVGGARRVRRFARTMHTLTRSAPWRIQRSSRAGLSIFRRQRR